MTNIKIIILVIVLRSTCAEAGAVDSEAVVAAHNKWRAQVGVPELSYSHELEVSAQAWADNLKQTNRCNMRH